MRLAGMRLAGMRLALMRFNRDAFSRDALSRDAKRIPGDSKSTANYRPISILPFLSKMFEKLMCARLDSYLK